MARTRARDKQVRTAASSWKGFCEANQFTRGDVVPPDSRAADAADHRQGGSVELRWVRLVCGRALAQSPTSAAELSQ